MVKYFAKVQNNVVQKVVSNTEKDWYIDTISGDWVQTYLGTDGKTFAEVGFTYDPELDNFISP